MASKPTQRSLKYCREQGWPVQVVERWNSHAGVRVDLFGCIDIVVLDQHDGVLGVQACAGGDLSKRLAKALTPPTNKKGEPIDPWPLRRWLERGNRFEIWGWRQVAAYRKDGKRAARDEWRCRCHQVSLEDLPSSRETPAAGPA